MTSNKNETVAILFHRKNPITIAYPLGYYKQAKHKVSNWGNIPIVLGVNYKTREQYDKLRQGGLDKYSEFYELIEPKNGEDLKELNSIQNRAKAVKILKYCFSPGVLKRWCKNVDDEEFIDIILAKLEFLSEHLNGYTTLEAISADVNASYRSFLANKRLHQWLPEELEKKAKQAVPSEVVDARIRREVII